MTAAAFFHQATEGVVAVALVLVGEQFVVAHPAAAGGIAADRMQQVGGGVVAVGFQIAANQVLAGDDAPAGVVVQLLLLFALAGRVTVEAADQVVAGVIGIAPLGFGRQLHRLFQAPTQATGEATAAVVLAAGDELPLGAQHLTMQTVALEAADQLIIQVKQLQVAAAVVQAADTTLVRQLRFQQVAEFVVGMLHGARGALLAEQLAEGIVGEGQ